MFTIQIFDGPTLAQTDNLRAAKAQAKAAKLRGESVLVRNDNNEVVYFCALWGHARKI